MPDAWTDKEDRMYEHIRKSAKQRGKSAERAREIAARTVNQYRREHGETPLKRTQGTGDPNSRLEERTVPELRNRAAELNIRGRSSMRKAELIEAIRQH
jgi:Rho termination factor, N-terminal domain